MRDGPGAACGFGPMAVPQSPSKSLLIDLPMRFINLMHKGWGRVALWSMLSLVVVTCSGSENQPTTTTDAPAVVTTATSVPAPTTTSSEVAPCPDLFCVVYHIRPEATWSDGSPVVSDDFVYTYRVLADPNNDVSSHSGYALISEYQVIDQKTVLFAFTEAYGAWQTLFAVVLPSHVLGEGAYEDEFELALGATSGPFTFDDRIEGESLTLVRNPQYWTETEPVSGLDLGDVNQIQFVFEPNVRDQLGDLDDGDIDVSRPRPLAWMVEEAQGMENVTLQVGPGQFWEHIDFNHADPLLSQRWIRDAISLGIDRQAILDSTIRPIDPAAQPLDSTVQMVNSFAYEPHFPDGFDPEAAEQILVDHLCEPGDDEIYVCQGQRMSFVWATTAGDPFRETQFDQVAAFLETIGIEVIADFMTPSQLFSNEVFFGGPEVWQIMNFSWKADADPHLANSTYYCMGSAPSGFGALNVNRYCDPEIEDLVRSTDMLVDQDLRVRAYNDADAAYLEDLALIPLYQKPAFMAWNAAITGPELNPSSATDFWNVGAWSGKETVIVALNAEPGRLNPIRPADANEALILAALFHGAYGIDSSMHFVPVLIEDAELILSDT